MSEYQVGQLLPVADGGYIRVLNPDWPSGTESFCERVDTEPTPPAKATTVNCAACGVGDDRYAFCQAHAWHCA